jgi:hypothetical protein
VIWDVDSMDRTQQEQLLTWMDNCGALVQVISLVERRLFPLVLREEFLDTLYYRLNVLNVPLVGNSDVSATPSRPIGTDGS